MFFALNKYENLEFNNKDQDTHIFCNKDALELRILKIPLKIININCYFIELYEVEKRSIFEKIKFRDRNVYFNVLLLRVTWI